MQLRTQSLMFVLVQNGGRKRQAIPDGGEFLEVNQRREETPDHQFREKQRRDGTTPARRLGVPGSNARKHEGEHLRRCLAQSPSRIVNFVFMCSFGWNFRSPQSLHRQRQAGAEIRCDGLLQFYVHVAQGGKERCKENMQAVRDKRATCTSDRSGATAEAERFQQTLQIHFSATLLSTQSDLHAPRQVKASAKKLALRLRPLIMGTIEALQPSRVRRHRCPEIVQRFRGVYHDPQQSLRSARRFFRGFCHNLPVPLLNSQFPVGVHPQNQLRRCGTANTFRRLRRQALLLAFVVVFFVEQSPVNSFCGLAERRCSFCCR
mmetsp:Transcript_10708/g.26232  ORF Transcript_10708/g.26232 Transcript_10708/m.26232 type:complete len:319 (-) Transcript_10708:664-1620(-)